MMNQLVNNKESEHPKLTFGSEYNMEIVKATPYIWNDTRHRKYAIQGALFLDLRKYADLRPNEAVLTFSTIQSIDKMILELTVLKRMMNPEGENNETK